MNTKFTKGPWHVRPPDGSKWGIDCANDLSVAQAQQRYPLPQDMYQVERTANAALIASAPELYEALSDAAHRIEELCDAYRNPLPDATMARIYAALKKARGEA